MPDNYLNKVTALFGAFLTISFADTAVGIVTLSVLLFWYKLKLKIPGHLPAIIIGITAMLILKQFNFEVTTIGSRFSYILPNGSISQGISSVLPEFSLPWISTDPQFSLSIDTFVALVPIAFTMAMLCAIESLLCAVVLDGMTKTKHNSNGELIGQGLGNMIIPFFGGISTTAAIARSPANVRAGATSPISAVIHALVVLLALISLAPILSYLPLSAMAALLLIIAWNMSGAHKVREIFKRAPKDNIIIMILCLSLTVLFDMVIAITAGIILASLLFIKLPT